MRADRVLQNVSDTACWVAYYRALESERPDALYHDPLARRLAGERGRAIARALPQGALGWSMAVRTRVLDEMILAALRAGSVRAVLNLAAGLDARPYRLALPPELTWIEVDLPAMIAEKERVLAGERACCRVTRVALDLADAPARRALFAEVGVRHGSVLVVTEGLLDYLTAEQVAELARDLRAVPALAGWLLMLAHPFVHKSAPRAWKRALRAAGAEFKFAPENGLAFFAPHGWYPREVRSLTEEALRLRRGSLQLALFRAQSRWTARARERFHRLVSFALLEPK